MSNGTLVCSKCNEVVEFSIELTDAGFEVTGVVLPISDALKVEFYRRGAAVLCRPCFQGVTVES